MEMRYLRFFYTVHSTRCEKSDAIAHDFNSRNVVMPKKAVTSKTIFSWAVDSHFFSLHSFWWATICLKRTTCPQFFCFKWCSRISSISTRFHCIVTICKWKKMKRKKTTHNTHTLAKTQHELWFFFCSLETFKSVCNIVIWLTAS